ncbi:unnamed protein product [Protopolystoma xenopodis]|uniref:Galactosyltransferase C-terminal domain-containing protein n=1 Tax=Protopolystoma xenopodis TaxID=117903 RepID=A0A3S5APU3_9PLAT|nr:unnamed protein product [Protopolystoma xenopodis]
MGGVTMINRWNYLLINGMSNAFTGWGGEDDDFALRHGLANVTRNQVSDDIGRFYSLEHSDDRVYDTERFSKLEPPEVRNRMLRDGLMQVTYTLLNVREYPLYTLYRFDL